MATSHRKQLEEKGVQYGCLAEAMLIDALAGLPDFNLFHSTTVGSQHSTEQLPIAWQNEDDLLATLDVMRSWQKHVCSNDGDFSLWCKERRINEAAVFKLTYELETRLRKVQQAYKVHHKPNFSGDVIGTEFLVKVIVQDVFKSNLCYYAGHKSLGYREVQSHWTVDFATPLSAKILGVKKPPQFIIYLASSDSKDTTCSFSASHVLTLDEQDAALLVSELTGESSDLLCKLNTVTPFVVSDVNQTTQERLAIQEWGHEGSALTEELTELCRGNDVIVEYDKSAKHLKVFAYSVYHEKLHSHLKLKVKLIEQEIQQGQVEIGCPYDSSDFRLVLHKGIQCKNMILPGEFRSLWVLELWPELVPRSQIYKEVLKLFPAEKMEYQDAVHLEQNRKILFKVTFETTQQASAALENTSSELFGVAAVTSGEYCRSSRSEHVNEPVIFNCHLMIEVAFRENGNKRQIKDHSSLKKSILEDLSHVGLTHGTEYFVAGPNVHRENNGTFIHCQNHTTCSAIRSFLRKRKVKFTVINEEDLEKQMRALKLTLDERLFRVMKSSLESVDGDLNIQCSAEPRKVLLTYSNVVDVNNLEKRLKDILKPVKRYGPRQYLTNLFYSESGEVFRDCMASKACVFFQHITHRQYDLYFPDQTPGAVVRSTIRQINSRSQRWYKIDLAHKRFPEGLATNLDRGDNFLSKSLKDYLQVQDVHVDLGKDILYFYTTEKEHPEVEKKINAFATNEVDSQPSECIACFDQLTMKTKAYTLKVCGHTYCTECLQSQFDVVVSCRALPIPCAECDEPFTCEDFLYVVRSQLIDMPQNFMRVVVSDFVSKCTGRYKFCPKPNCPGVLETTEKVTHQTSIVCFACQCRICQKCWNIEHPEMSCEELDDVRIVVKKWVEQSPEKRKYCPNCQMGIEKFSGCNNVYCGWCKCSMCWVCLKSFDDSCAVYDHLDEVHGGYD